MKEGIISLEELLKEFEEKKMFGMIMSCKVMMGEKILNLDEHKNGRNIIIIFLYHVSLR